MLCDMKHALVTGASSGIGRSTARRLARDGFHVFATVRRRQDAAALQDSARGALTPLIMDIVQPDQVAAAAVSVRDHVGESGLDVLVNNAGVGVFQPLELVAPRTFRWQLEVNVTGQVEVTQAFLPLLRLATGRIVMIGSVAGRITVPFAGPQAAAKHALVALTEALRLELAPWNIRVVLIEPASVHTDAIDKFERDSKTALLDFGATGRALYGQAFQNMTERGLEQERHGSHPDEIAAVVARAVNSKRPRPRYLAGKHARTLMTIAKLPSGFRRRILTKVFALPRPGSLAHTTRTPHVQTTSLH